MNTRIPTVSVVLVFSFILSACGPSAEEIAATYVAQTATAASPTPR